MKSLTPDDSDKTNITSNEWITHYNQLLSTDNNNYNNNFLDYVKQSLPIIENVNDKGPLDFIISETDVYSSIKSLMNRKSVGLVGIKVLLFLYINRAINVMLTIIKELQVQAA